LDKPTRGGYILDGIPVHEMDDNRLSEVRSKKIGFVFQSFNLLSRINSIKNVELSMMYAGVPIGKRHKRALELLEIVGMSDRANHKPNELSGGQTQRVAIARALSNEPSLILADEPTGALDSKTSDMVIDMFLDIHKKEGTTVVIITHSREVADRCDRVVKMVDGKIVSDDERG
jgi:putative ABC transport system ATP-binding protein